MYDKFMNSGINDKKSSALSYALNDLYKEVINSKKVPTSEIYKLKSELENLMK